MTTTTHSHKAWTNKGGHVTTNSCTCCGCLITQLRSGHRPRVLHHSKGRDPARRRSQRHGQWLAGWVSEPKTEPNNTDMAGFEVVRDRLQ